MNNIIDEKRKKRLQFLNALYEYSEGETDNDILPEDLGKKIGLSYEESHQISQFLSNEGLIKFVYIIDKIAITHKGIITIENALSKPQEETEYFPPVSIVIMGNVSDTNIQLGNNNQIEIKNTGSQNDRTMDAE